MKSNDTFFLDPPPEFAVQPIAHKWPENRDVLSRALKAYGCRGTVINCPFNDGFTSNPENLKKLAQQMDSLDRAGLKYWLYDEAGYPSGMANGLTLEGHPELEAKGFFMRRIAAYEPRHIEYHLDCEADKIIHAAVYLLRKNQRLDEARIDWSSYHPVPFTAEQVVIDLKPGETLFIFSVKRAHEGSQATHNTWSRNRYINIMDPKAVRRFIDVAYEPIVKALPDAYRRVEAVFTDEPSLMTVNIRDYEQWNFALLPWADILPERFEAEYGRTIFPELPLLFEGEDEAYSVRCDFYNLVGIMIAEAWSGQLQSWCKAHGGTFSGHYLAEEGMICHVLFYGNFIEVLKHTGFPGIDTLSCMPEDYHGERVTKYVQMAARKKNCGGMMVEICPFMNIEEFNKDPINNMTEVAGELFLGGVRHINSYFQPDFSQYDKELPPGFMDQEQTLQFNRYLSRIRLMLDGLDNDCEVFVYYNLEEVQAKLTPRYRSSWSMTCAIEQHTDALGKQLYNSGCDFYYADLEDLENGAKTGMISGHKVKLVLVPESEIIRTKTMLALKTLQANGTKVLFIGKIPQKILNANVNTGDFSLCSIPAAVAAVKKITAEFRIETTAERLPQAKFTTREGDELHWICNPARKPMQIKVSRTGFSTADFLNPEDGSIRKIELERPIEIPAMRGIFLRFDFQGK